MLMSCAISQRFAPGTRLIHRILVGFDLTDEVFGIAIARPGYVDPYYSYGAMISSMPGWAVGTALGIALGNVMPPRVVSALSVALFGMFLAIIIPPARRNKVVLAFVALGFAASAAFEFAPVVSALPGGTRTIILTVTLSAVAALLFPVEDGGAGELGEDEASLESLGEDVVDAAAVRKGGEGHAE
jgi:predicted branched-subunit amino acid permease